MKHESSAKRLAMTVCIIAAAAVVAVGSGYAAVLGDSVLKMCFQPQFPRCGKCGHGTAWIKESGPYCRHCDKTIEYHFFTDTPKVH